MKITSKRFVLTVLLVLCWVAVFSMDPDEGGGGPPDCPCGRTDVGGTSAGPSPPVGECLECPLPIDESIMILLIIAIVFGIYIIYRNNLKTKNPI
jgi:hypothetical protein